MRKKYQEEIKKDLNINELNEEENYRLFCSKCGEKLIIEEINDIILNNNKIKNYTTSIESQIENIVTNNPINTSDIQLKNVNEILKMINENINKNNEIIFNLFRNKDKDKTKENNDNNKILKIELKDINNEKLPPDIISKKIKSNYIIKIIFSYFHEKNKLEIIKYNKNLQNKLGINLINYKLFKGVYIEYESKTKGKEIYGDTGKVRFKGEYLNGKRNGKGKEYDDDILNFEGEYLNGKRNGKGKEYFKSGDLYFEGEYINGKESGKAKIYYNDGKILFEGEYLDGYYLNGKFFDKNNNFTELKNGEGFIKRYYTGGGLFFEGEYLNGKKNGNGKEYDYDGNLIFEGEYKNDKKWNGKGYDCSNNIAYELKNGFGEIKIFKKGKIIFEGRYIKGEINGKVKEYYDNGTLKFEGIYLNNKKNGKGKEYYDNGELEFEGEYLNNERYGIGKEYNEYGKLLFEGKYLYYFKLSGKNYLFGKLEYEGEYLYNKKWNGKGFDGNGNIIYELKNGNGKVKEYNDDFLEFEGEYLDGKRNGIGKEYNEDNQLIYYGEYLNGERWNGVVREDSDKLIGDLYINGKRYSFED